MAEICKHGQRASICTACKDERIAELERERDEWHHEALKAITELAAAQATIQQMRKAMQGPNCECFAGCHICFNWITEEQALALPADRTALDAMLAEAEKRGMLKAADVCEEYQGSAETCADAIRQAAERGE